MGNTFFYHKVSDEQQNITWKDIFSESFKKHSKSELEHVFAAGTVHNRASEYDMLAKWDRPWVWFPALKIGLCIVAMVYAIYLLTYIISGNMVNAMQLMVTIIPTLVVPLVIMLFLWELNIPKNISIFECIAWWLVGGLLSIGISMVIVSIPDVAELCAVSNGFAAVSEEPGKLITSVILIAYAKQSRKIYGLTGLVIGACVGAGFGAFESMQYAYNIGYNISGIMMIVNQFLRAVLALGGHTLFCAPYAAAVALHMKNSKFSIESFINVDVFVSFMFSSLMHFCWNFEYPDMYGLFIVKLCIITVCLWLMLLWMLNKCLKQVVNIGNYSHTAYVVAHSNIVSHDSVHNSAPAWAPAPVVGTAAERMRQMNMAAGAVRADVQTTFMLVCHSGALKGAIWKGNIMRPLNIGRMENNEVRLPNDERGVSRQHCRIVNSSGGWRIEDLNSRYGTFVNGKRLEPGASFVLASGDEIQLADSQNRFRIVIE